MLAKSNASHGLGCAGALTLNGGYVVVGIGHSWDWTAVPLPALTTLALRLAWGSSRAELRVIQSIIRPA